MGAESRQVEQGGSTSSDAMIFFFSSSRAFFFAFSMLILWQGALWIHTLDTYLILFSLFSFLFPFLCVHCVLE